MKQFLLILTLSICVVSCGSADKKAQLEKLRADYASLGEQIRRLEAELGASSSSAENPNIKFVEVATLENQPFSRKVTIQGTVDGDEIVTLNPRASGELVYLNAKVGQAVKAGEELARIDDKILKKSMVELQTSLDLAKTVYERQAALWKDSIGSEIQYIQAKNQKKALEDRIASLKEQMDLYVVRAPFGGTIESVPVKIGQMVSPVVPLAMMINLTKLKLVAEVSENYSSSVAKGDKVSVNFPDINKSYDLTITSVSNYINPKNRTFLIESVLPSGITDVKANMLAKIAIESYKSANTIAIPINLVFANNSGEFVYVLEQREGKSYAVRRAIKTGVKSERDVEILEGLQVGDKIVTTGYQTLEDGVEVSVK